MYKALNQFINAVERIRNKLWTHMTNYLQLKKIMNSHYFVLRPAVVVLCFM